MLVRRFYCKAGGMAAVALLVELTKRRSGTKKEYTELADAVRGILSRERVDEEGEG